MKAGDSVEKKVLKKIQKRLRKVIKMYEKLIAKLEVQLEKVDLLLEEEVVSTVRLTIVTGLNQSRLFLLKAQADYQKIVTRLADF